MPTCPVWEHTDLLLIPAVLFMLHYLVAMVVCGTLVRRTEQSREPADTTSADDGTVRKRQGTAAFLVGTSFAPFAMGLFQMLAWGVIPNTGEEAETITLDQARQALENALQLFERKGFDRQELLAKALFTPACGTGTLAIPVAERVMRLTRELSDQVREEYGLA